MVLSEEATRHARVLRLTPGDALTLFDGDGWHAPATLSELGKRAVCEAEPVVSLPDSNFTAAALTEAQRAQLEQIEGFTVELCGPGGGCEVVDVEGTFKAWLDDIDAKYVLIRPDFYVALTANNAETLQSRFDKVMAELHLASQTAVAAE